MICYILQCNYTSQEQSHFLKLCQTKTTCLKTLVTKTFHFFSATKQAKQTTHSELTCLMCNQNNLHIKS